MDLQLTEKEKSFSEKINELKEKNKSKVADYNIVYDSFAEGLEPIYFWILDFMQEPYPSGIGLDEVMKSKDEYEAAVGSGFFSDLGTKATRMQEQAMKMMSTINTVIRSVINLIYDLREFDIRLDLYNDLKSPESDTRDAAEIALRAVWMDQVDVKRGRGSINMLTQQLEFVTLRDGFLYADNVRSVEQLDLNDRVKRILKSRLTEYFKWKEYSEKELRKRYNIEKSYLKSQVNSLKYYIKWVKPYLLAAKKLEMTNFFKGGSNPNIVDLFNNLEIHLTLFGKKKIDPRSLNPEFKNLKLNTDYYACIECEIKFRTVPRASQTQQGLVYIHGGRTEITIKAYSFNKEELQEFNKLQNEEDLELIEGMVDVSLKEIQEDIEKYMVNAKEEEKKEKINYPNPFSGLGEGFKSLFKPFKYVANVFKFSKSSDEFYEKLARDAALSQAEALAYVLYDVYKKGHGMMSW